MSLNNLGLGFVFTAKDMATGAVNKINSNIENLAGTSEEAQKRITSATDAMKKGLGMVGAGVAIAGLAAIPVAVATGFQKGMAEVSTLGEFTKKELDSMGSSVLGLAAKYGTSLDTATNAMYNTVSASVAAGDSAAFMDAAFKASVAGVTDANTSVDALSTILNGYQGAVAGVSVGTDGMAATAARASDLLFTAVQKGKTTFPELASYIGQVIPSANALGVGFDQVAASYATMTKQGINTANATTLIKSTLTAAMSKQKEAAKMGPEVAKAFSLQALKAEGLQKWLVNVSDAVGGSKEKLVKLLGSSEAVSAILAMTGNNAKTAASDLKAMGEGTGVTDKAFAKMSNTMDFQMNRAGKSVKVLLAQVGDDFTKALTPATEDIGDIVGAMADWAGENPKVVSGILKATVAIGGLVAAVGAGLFLYGLSAAIGVVTVGLKAMAVSAWAAVAPFLPIIGVVAGITAVVGGLAYIFRDELGAAWDGVKEGFVRGMEILSPAITSLKTAFSNLWTSVQEILTPLGMFTEETSEADSAAGGLSGAASMMGNLFGESLAGGLGIVVHILTFMVDVIGVVSMGFKLLGTAIGEMVGFVSVHFRSFAAMVLDFVLTPIQSILKIASSLPLVGDTAKALSQQIDNAVQFVAGDSQPPANGPAVAQAQGQANLYKNSTERRTIETEKITKAIGESGGSSSTPGAINVTLEVDGERLAGVTNAANSNLNETQFAGATP